MKKLEEISAIYIAEGKGEIAAAIIQHATLEKQKMAIGTAKDLTDITKQNQLTYPAIIIGETFGLNKNTSLTIL